MEATPPTPPSRLAPPPSPPSATPTTTASTTPAATNTPYTFLRSISTDSSIPHHLVFTGLALLLASGFIVRRLHSKNRYRTPPPTIKGIKKRKQDVVKSILIAQGQEKSEEGLNVGGIKSRSRGNSLGTGTEPKSTNLLPSAACITSTSAAILQGFEKISSALSSNTSSISKPSTPTLHRSTSPDSPTREMPGDLRIVGDTANGGKRDEGMKKGKNKKGKAAVVPTETRKGTTSSSDMSRTSSRGLTKEMGRESGAKVSAGTTDTGVQVSQVDLEGEGNFRYQEETTPTSTTGFDLQTTDQPPSSTNPPRPLPPSSSDPPTTSTVSVQTSPHLLPYRDRTPISTPPRLHSPPPISSPAPTRPAAVPLPFDLHASFQATPSSSTPTAEKDYPLSLSPTLSLTPSRSPSSSPSVSSGSPTSRRPASPSTRRSSSTSTSATPSLQANGSASTSSSRSRKQARKASGVTPIGLNGKSIVGLPKSGEKGKDGEGVSGKNETKSETNNKTKSNGRDRPAPIPIPSSASSSLINGNDTTPQPQRRLSTASSAYSTSNFSLTSSGSPHSTERVALPTMPPAMTMTPPDFARRASSSVGQDRDESLRWSSNARSREASLRGLGVEIDRGGDSEDGSVEGSDVRSTLGDSLRGISPRPTPNGYFSLSTNPQSQLGRSTSTSNYFGSPDSSPLPSHRTIPPFAAPTASLPPQQPWSPHSNNQNTSSLMPYPIVSSSSSGNSTAPNASRPPSRQSSLSVPPNSSQQQQIQLHQHQQQQAYAIAHVQAQAAAQYQHVVALQYQAQVQQQQNQRQRRRTGEGGLAFDDTPSVPNGLVYPLSSTGPPGPGQGQSNWHSGSPHPVSPMTPSYPHLAQAVSPTSTTFAPTAVAAHAQAQAQAQMYQNYMNQSAAYYLAAQGGGGGGPSATPHASPAHPQQQHPTRPRINSSVSAVAVLGSASSSAKNGSISSPVSAGSKSMASPRMLGPNEKQRQIQPTVLNGSTPFSPLGAGADSRSVSAGSNDLSVWKARAKEAEMEADRNAKELEIARWRLSVLEEDQRTNEVEVSIHILSLDYRYQIRLTFFLARSAEPRSSARSRYSSYESRSTNQITRRDSKSRPTICFSRGKRSLSLSFPCDGESDRPKTNRASSQRSVRGDCQSGISWRRANLERCFWFRRKSAVHSLSL